MTLREIVAANIRRLRIAENLTQLELAKKAGLTDVYVSRLEKHSQNITLDSLEAIAEALKVPPVSLLDGSKVFSIKTKNAKVSAQALRQAADALESLADSLENE